MPNGGSLIAMDKIYTPEEKEELARRTARTFGCEAVSW
jgi:hypothetical protein